jgi:hypothetical protein
VATQLKSKPGLSGATALSIPKDWDPAWFRHFIHNQLKGADVRNAAGSGGIAVSGTIATPYATIGFAAPIALPAPVTIVLPSAVGPILIVGINNSQSTPLISVRSAAGAGVSGNEIEFGHPNPAGYGSNIGFEVGSGKPFIAFNAEAGTTVNTYRTRGIAGIVLQSDVAGAFLIGRVTTASADNQSVTNSVTVASTGAVAIAAPSSGQTLTVAPSPSAGELIATSSALTNGAGAAVGTLTNAPSAGNPTKWIKINDNGTVRSVPAW